VQTLLALFVEQHFRKNEFDESVRASEALRTGGKEPPARAMTNRQAVHAQRLYRPMRMIDFSQTSTRKGLTAMANSMKCYFWQQDGNSFGPLPVCCAPVGKEKLSIIRCRDIGIVPYI
jgi:hypothetical protein